MLYRTPPASYRTPALVLTRTHALVLDRPAAPVMMVYMPHHPRLVSRLCFPARFKPSLRIPHSTRVQTPCSLLCYFRRSCVYCTSALNARVLAPCSSCAGGVIAPPPPTRESPLCITARFLQSPLTIGTGASSLSAVTMGPANYSPLKLTPRFADRRVSCLVMHPNRSVNPTIPTVTVSN